MKLFSLHLLILKLSKSIKTNDHSTLILVKEALINYYNGSFLNSEAVLAETKISISKFLVDRTATPKSCEIMKALINNTISTLTIEGARHFVGDLILVADASISALEEVKLICDTRRLLKRRGRYYYSGRSGSDIAKVGYTLGGESGRKGSGSSSKLYCEGKTTDGCLLQYVLVSSLG
uniref:19.6 kDa protein n=1 Tax=Grapevine leafroll-associated virus 3 TaxID=55951 RepID=A0A2S0M2W7_9CLOS|nr:19.6 kDa protein [Grapevine leafroll-associated virus 3]AXI81995.1 19.6 kDa protein [Grapevine leafroll-associated virus 3]AXI82007.1 19.6 kDa protein [Grapevine leafroll-associated virus 3]AXI82032.1 19.6 kDa protein [Grapevine leafroll-associated virus 3]